MMVGKSSDIAKNINKTAFFRTKRPDEVSGHH